MRVVLTIYDLRTEYARTHLRKEFELTEAAALELLSATRAGLPQDFSATLTDPVTGYNKRKD